MNWTVEFYRDAKNREPARDFLDTLPIPTQAKAVRLIKLLEKYGVLLKEPYTRKVAGKIRELRFKDAVGFVRILYFTYTGRRFVLLHGFVKKTKTTPQEEIEIAEKRMDDFIDSQGG